MEVTEQHPLTRIASTIHITLCAVWIFLGVQLMVTDVWDESNGLTWFYDPHQSLAQKCSQVWTKPVALFRPLPTIFTAVVIHYLQNDEFAWRLLRAANMGLMLVTLSLLHKIREVWGVRSHPHALAVTVLTLYSGSACIAAGWYVNCFDVWALLFLVAGLFLLSRQQVWTAGLSFGVAFFCKETAILIFPFLLLLVAMQRVPIRAVILAAIPAVVGAGSYFVLRSVLIDFGSAHDIHLLRWADVWPTLMNFTESFWRQTMKDNGQVVSGFVWLTISLLTVPHWRGRAGLALFFLSIVPVYLGMFASDQQGKLIHHWNFIGRLYLIPGVLVLLSLVGHTWGLMLLAIPILSGALITYSDHMRFQRAYVSIHALAERESERPLLLYSSVPLPIDTRRSIQFGDFPAARWELDLRNGSLSKRATSQAPALERQAVQQ
ncbi:MAG: hypothetical protein FJ147_09810 [Deltaproteobacteria bacterium]|nr:hypothetical protein [Deltaproteobacteria bacterium]